MLAFVLLLMQLGDINYGLNLRLRPDLSADDDGGDVHAARFLQSGVT